MIAMRKNLATPPTIEDFRGLAIGMAKAETKTRSLIDIHDDIAARLSRAGLHDALVCFGDGQGGISVDAYARSLADTYAPEQAMQIALEVERSLKAAMQ